MNTFWRNTITSSQEGAPQLEEQRMSINNGISGERVISINSTESATTAAALQARRLDVFFQETVSFDLGLGIRFETDAESLSSTSQTPD